MSGQAMSDAYLNQQPVWKVLYEAAILEFNRQILLQRIDEARVAITAQRLRNQQNGNSDEDERLMQALWGLDELIRMRVPDTK
jgi:hypothetical protein